MLAFDIDEKRVVDRFLELVRIDSPSKHEAEVAKHCAKVLGELGFDVRIDGTAERTGCESGNVIGFLPASPSVAGAIALASHMDTVEPGRGIEPIITDGIISSAGDTVLGSDDKSGIASIIEAVQSIIENGAEHPNILVIFTTGEEIGLLGATALELTETERETFAGAPCLVADSDGAPGAITIGAAYHYEFVAEFKGLASHAGVEPDKGRSAIRMASEAISMMRLGGLGELATANIGSIGGGTATNVIPDSCKIEGECRAMTSEEVEAIRDDMQRCMESGAAKFGGSVDAKWKLSYPGMKLERDDELVLKLEGVANDLGLPFSADYSAGGSDANILGSKGFKPITVATGMTNFHATNELIEIEDLRNCARFIMNAIVSL
ncbi:MAG: M20/M25/M40 family metallo-hydrolase [bacterium]|nr:M20/M25/M40 family metallo-hydrolase [bacterium]